MNNPQIQLLNIDCFDYMKTVEDKHFDICLTSPPYNMNLRVNQKGTGYCSRQIVKELSTKYQDYSDNLPMDEYRDLLISSVTELLRISNLVFFNIQMITGNKPALFEFMGHFSSQIKELIVWDKCKAQPAIGGGVLNSGYELIIVLGDKPITRAFQSPQFDRGTLANVWKIPANKNSTSTNRASFPLLLVDTVMNNFTWPGARVFDPFSGTGKTAIGAHRRGCSFVGCELSKATHGEALQAFDMATSQSDLFGYGEK